MRRHVVVALVLLVVCAVVVTTVVLRTQEAGPRPVGPAAAGPAVEVPAIEVVTGETPVCGIPDLAQVVDDGVDATTLPGWRTVVDDVLPAAGELVTLRVHRGTAFVLSRDEATYTVARYDVDDGSPQGETVVELRWDPAHELFGVSSFEVDDDGAVYLVDPLMGRRDLLKIAPDGSERWRVPLPAGDQSTGAVTDLAGSTVAWDDPDDGRVVGVGDAGAVLHRVTAAGERLDPVDVDGSVLGALDGGAVAYRADGPQGRSLTVASPDGEVEARVGAPAPVDRPVGVPSLPWTDPTGVATAPDGGLLLAEPGTGLHRFGTDGVRHGFWPATGTDVDRPFAPWDRTPVLHHGGDYYLLTHGRGGSVSLTAISDDRMAYGLRDPVEINAGTESRVATLGLGAGLLVDRPFAVFGAGETPRVVAAFDPAWGAHADRYRLRYQVRGDPRVPDPVVGDVRVTDLPAGGGELELELPPARPGVYEVDAALLDTDDVPVSGTCLRYTVTPPGSRLDPSALADGADWGGAAPLRGVQIADQLGVGSHRVQLDLGALVPDPTATPDPAAIVWDALPGAGLHAQDGEIVDPFAELAAAARLAERTGVRLVVQVGQGSEADRAAVDAGTWRGWVEAVVDGVREGAPGITAWQPWNEPNNTGYEDPARYEREVGAPFAEAVRAADPEAVVVGGNTLGLAPDWWRGLVDAGGCSSMDAVGIHPYTGFNRSWEEEGFSRPGAELDELREILAVCDELPWWDTESGWWSDGVVNFWASGWDVARKLWWYEIEDVAEWTYFFSEGGFGENGVSWSLVQHDAYVKPAGAAMAATAPLVERYDAATAVETGVPGVHAVRAVADDGASVLALWSEDLSTSVVIAPADGSAGGVEVVRRDVYGAEAPLDVPADGTEVPVNGSPVALLVPAGESLAVRPAEPFGDDVLAGAAVTASSTHPDAGDPTTVTSGTFAVRDPWRSGRLDDGSVDPAPSVTVETDAPVEVNRIAVATAGIRCCTAGLRHYTVEVRTPDGDWREIPAPTDQLWDRVALLRTDPVEITAVRVSVPWTRIRGHRVLDVNYTGVLGGPPQPFMGVATESDWLVAVSAVQAWAPP
ncbi:hypothetical protein BCE75_106137 [Isoptericola sp. CG 20/1183]|uniref:F5/8 type C domain-containing protein n=1 Tax=Isoptericola halotolerans TaxID=300560 RepID=A0ABX5EDD7_9MICO|nr:MULTISPECIES: hypothetical protein [Isoptericola]PRZ06423.1 hypothetical protein BCL65_10697 [Isoptericola halotolerans]PRZ06771.1 hypothetical protein BCE75_106137 [Isoptericola sp. CG 20/1183]